VTYAKDVRAGDVVRVCDRPWYVTSVERRGPSVLLMVLPEAEGGGPPRVLSPPRILYLLPDTPIGVLPE